MLRSECFRPSRSGVLDVPLRMRRIQSEGVNAGLVRRVEISLEYHTAREMRNGGLVRTGGVYKGCSAGGDMREGGHESARRMENAINSHHQQRARE